MTVFPAPKKMICGDAFTNPNRSFCLVKDDFCTVDISFVKDRLDLQEAGIPLRIVFNPEYQKEQYSLELDNAAARITASTARGVFNAVITLQMITEQDDLCCVRIDDAPDFEDRGVMIDYSRGRIPTIEEIKKTVDRLARMKYNQIQMAFDSIVFEYKGLEKYYGGSSIVTTEYVKEIQAYCKKNLIELVPNQNSFGHMHDWLKLDDFKDLAECPGGFHRTDEYNRTALWSPGTLDPYDPRSLELVDRIYGGLLPYFESPKLHACCDETFDLISGEGKSAEKLRKLGVKKVYTQYMEKLNLLCQKYGKRMMFWADMIIDSVDALKEMPKDAIAVIWGYEQEYPYEQYCKNAKESGLAFYVAPGTSSWASIVGRSNNMKYNQLSAAENGKKYGAKGYLLTDWGSHGHVQFPVVTHLPIAYGAGLAWGVNENKEIEGACDYLDDSLFHEKGFSRFLYDCGNAHCLEPYKRFNTAAVITVLEVPLDDNVYMEGQTPEHYKNIVRLAEEQLKKLERFLSCDKEHIEEIRLNLEILKTMAKVCIIKTGGTADPLEIIAEFERENKEFKRLWLTKNLETFSDVYINLTKNLADALQCKTVNAQ